MTDFEKAFEEVQLLVQKFENNKHHYMSPGYSEAEARQDFIDDFFTVLGWDVTHKYQHDPHRQDVKIEKSQKQQNESARKRADYAFYLTPNFKDVHFFVEAKKPAVLIQNNPVHYFQTIKYGWNAMCPISVLTDFEEFVIIDCRHKPDIKFALNGAHQKFRYTDYTDKEKFAAIYYLLSKEAVQTNSIENYVSKLPKAKGKATQKTLFPGAYKEIDEDFLNYIDGIRENLAKAFKKNDESLDSEALTEATQRTVDRLVFIRFLEDKLIEPHNHISEYGMSSKSVWKDFITDCRALDGKYNGVVFKKHFIDEQDFIGAEDKAFADICADISNVNSPYHFNYIPIHILGSIYERFLGKVVRATDKRVFIEEKPEVRKAGGVYYTPKYIVDYIVENTVGKLIEDKKPDEIADMHFADIACGSGSFLIGVYDCLLKYHNDFYQTNTTQAKKDGCELRDGQYVLTLKQKQDILLHNIYGVDIDAQAVEVTQLSLFLKMLEDENVSTTQKQGTLFLKVLPDLSNNIKCGNSLIGTDILSGQLFNFEEEKALNPFDYKTAFPKVMKNGGFDAIVGNPPYVSIQRNFLDDNSWNYIKQKYISVDKIADLFVLFIERCTMLLRKTGKHSYIVPSTLLINVSFEKLREKLIKEYNLNNLLLFGDGIFKDAVVPTCVYVLENDFNNENQIEVTKNIKDFNGNKFERININQSSFLNQPHFNFNIEMTEEFESIFQKMKLNSKNLEEYVDVKEGVKTGNDKFFISDIKVNSNYYPLVKGRDINKYEIDQHLYLNYDIKALDRPQKIEHFIIDEKLFVRRVAKNIIATYDNQSLFCVHTLYTIRRRLNQSINLKFILALLNSKLFNFYQRKVIAKKGEIFPEIRINTLNKLPIKEDNQQHDKLVNLVEQMLQSKQQLPTEKIEKNKNYLEQKCINLDKQIDEVVYALYGLSEDEIKIIEEN